MSYAQHHGMTDADREVLRREVEFDTLLREMEEWQAVLVLRLKILRRSGPNEQLLRGIEEAGKEFTLRMQLIMDDAANHPPRLTAPNKGNRYG